MRAGSLELPAAAADLRAAGGAAAGARRTARASPPPRDRSIRSSRRGDAAYGINTGFGLLAQTRIPDDQLAQLQRNLLLSHAAGVGAPLPDAVVRLILALKINALARGYSGISPAARSARCARCWSTRSIP